MLCWCFGAKIPTGSINSPTSVRVSPGTVLPLKNDEQKGERGRQTGAFWTGGRENMCLHMYIHTYINTVCIRGAHVAITEEHNIRRHHETKHRDKHKDMTQGCQKVEEMKRGLVS